MMREIWCGALDPDEVEAMALLASDAEGAQDGVEAGAEVAGDVGAVADADMDQSTGSTEVQSVAGARRAAADVNTWRRGWKRFWRPVGRKEYWRAVLHLALLNFPFVRLHLPLFRCHRCL